MAHIETESCVEDFGYVDCCVVGAGSAIAEGRLCSCGAMAEVDGNNRKNEDGNDKNNVSRKISRKQMISFRLVGYVKDQQGRTFTWVGLYVRH